MLNMICAVIVTIAAIGIYQQKWSPHNMERQLASFPLFVQAVLPILLALTLWASLFGMDNILGLPRFAMDQSGLLIHEAGHFYLSWAGTFLHFFGGTLFELGVPAALAIWFFKMGLLRWTSIFIGWLSVGFFGVALYAGDAQDRVLTLIGGTREDHDWYNMLTMLGWLDATSLISDVFWSCGLVAGLGSILLALWVIHTSSDSKGLVDPNSAE